MLPSFREGFPIVGLEAISEGAEVAWSRIGPHIELCGDAGAPCGTATGLATFMGRQPHRGIGGVPSELVGRILSDSRANRIGLLE
jgi:hypothetical protein